MSPAESTLPADGNPFRISRLNHSRDFRPEWDVESWNSAQSNLVLGEIRSMAGRTTADPGVRIPILLSQAGYGKTHLLGRLANSLGSHAIFIFVGAIPDPRRIPDHVRWTVVESLLKSESGNPSPLEAAFATLLEPSITKYAERYTSDAVKHARLSKASSITGTLEILRGRKIGSYHRVAASLAARIPHVKASIVRAMIMCLSSDGHIARSWLRGEKLSEDDTEKLGILDDAPTAQEILVAITAVLENRKPLVVCFDQIEPIVKDHEGIKQFGNYLMELLATVPNQYLIVSCYVQAWILEMRQYLPNSLLRRARELELDTLTPQHAVNLVKKRLRSVPKYAAKPGELWPFDTARFEQFVRDDRPMPDSLIRLCETALEAWLSGKTIEPLVLGTESQPTESLAQLFDKRWIEELSSVQSDPRRQIQEKSDAQVFGAAKEVVRIMKSVGDESPLRINLIKEGVLGTAGSSSRYGMRVEIIDGLGKYSVILGATTIMGGNGLFNYLREFARAVKTARGGLLLHPRNDYKLGQVGEDLVKKMKQQSKLEIFTLSSHRDMFVKMECAVGLLEQAQAGALTLSERAISYEQCQRLIWESGVLKDLPLLQSLAKWKSADREPASPVGNAAGGSMFDGQLAVAK